MLFDQEYFDMGLNRMGTRSEKWDACREEHGAEVLPVWVADMDFPSPPACQEAILRRAAHPTYCYTEIREDDYRAVTDFWQRRHGVTVEPDCVLMLPCVVTGLKMAIHALTEPGDGVVILSPVYGPFRFSVEATGRRLMDCPLKRDDNHRYSIDPAAIEEALKNGGKLIMLCNPHNPVSRLWSEAELKQILDLLDRYDAYLVSDEIHADFVYPEAEFVSVLKLRQERVLVLGAASKTFNLAGLQQACCLCPDETLREKMKQAINACGVTSGNIFALEATRAAYEQGDAWLDGLLRYLDTNRKLLAELVKTELPKAVLTPVEATYLAWIDLTAYGFTCEELKKRTEAAGVIFTEGTFFGQGGESHLRLNFGCPARYVTEAVRRLKKALEA